MAPNGGAQRTLSSPQMPRPSTGEFCFTPNAERQSILWRPRTATSKTTFDTLDRQLEWNEQRVQKVARAYRVQTDKHYHNSRPHDLAPTFWDNGRIVDKGKGKGVSRDMHGTYNPINNMWTVPPSNNPMGDPPASCDETYKRQKSYAHMCTLGEYNPILHKWERLPTQEDQRMRDRAVHIKCGFVTESGHKKRVPCPQGTFDPIKCKWIQRPPNNAWLDKVNGTWLPSGRRIITQGETWGQHNPVLNHWLQLPAHPKYQNPERVALLESGILTKSKKRVPAADSQGVYDPVKNLWIVPPKDPAMYDGLSFAPRSTAKQCVR